ncbi:MAG: acyltransferase [Blastochloris sp.]|nr:acyltransferase [Blastochloris sp.]
MTQLLNILKKASYLVRRLRARFRGVTLGRANLIEHGVILHPFQGYIRAGDHVFLGPHVIIYGHGGVNIGDNCLIAGHVCIASSNHTIPPQGVWIRSQPDIPLPVRIGNDVWIGFGAVILGGVTIGEGCIIGAGAVVTKDLPAGAIAAGNPARILRFRGEQPTS